MLDVLFQNTRRRRTRVHRRRRGRPLGTVPSLLLCGAAAVLCVRSYVVNEVVTFSAVRPDRDGARAEERRIESSNGRIAYTSHTSRREGSRAGESGRPWDVKYERDQPGQPWFDQPIEMTPYHAVRFLGLRHEKRSINRFSSHVAVVPYWMLVLLFGAGPAWAVVRRRYHLLPAGNCAVCGYVARAGEASCPLCGATIDRPPA
jgi:hypothetical protein